MKRKSRVTESFARPSYIPLEYGCHSDAPKRQQQKLRARARGRSGARSQAELFCHAAGGLDHPRRRISQDDSVLDDQRQQEQQPLDQMIEQYDFDNEPLAPPPPQLQPLPLYPSHRYNLQHRARLYDARANNLQSRMYSTQQQFLKKVKNKAAEYANVIAAFGNSEFYDYYQTLKRQQQAHTRLIDLGNAAYCMPIWDYEKQTLNYKKYAHCFRSPSTGDWVCDCPMWGDPWKCAHTLIAIMEDDPKRFNTTRIASKIQQWQVVNEYVTFVGSFQKR